MNQVLAARHVTEPSGARREAGEKEGSAFVTILRPSVKRGVLTRGHSYERNSTQ